MKVQDVKWENRWDYKYMNLYSTVYFPLHLKFSYHIAGNTRLDRERDNFSDCNDHGKNSAIVERDWFDQMYTVLKHPIQEHLIQEHLTVYDMSPEWCLQVHYLFLYGMEWHCTVRDKLVNLLIGTRPLKYEQSDG